MLVEQIRKEDCLSFHRQWENFAMSLDRRHSSGTFALGLMVSSVCFHLA